MLADSERLTLELMNVNARSSSPRLFHLLLLVLPRGNRSVDRERVVGRYAKPAYRLVYLFIGPYHIYGSRWKRATWKPHLSARIFLNTNFCTACMLPPTGHRDFFPLQRHYAARLFISLRPREAEGGRDAAKRWRLNWKTRAWFIWSSAKLFRRGILLKASVAAWIGVSVSVSAPSIREEEETKREG